jgi:hypothetical protein
MRCDGFRLILLPLAAGRGDDIPGDGVDIIARRI